MKDPATLYAVCGVAACVVLSQQGAIARCQIAATGSTAYPMRLPAIEKALTGAKPDAAAVSAAAGAITDDGGFRGDFYASKEYRVHLTRVLTERALKRAVARATT
jgi:carbon-monoxide dehydrogenase medium subunit